MKMIGLDTPLSVLVPEWAEILLGEKFFTVCSVHSTEKKKKKKKKNEKNIFCLDCSTALCSHCLPHHHDLHSLLQIRRYVYHDVIRINDANKLNIDCSSIQEESYKTNKAKVVFLKQRPISPLRVSSSKSFCIKCDRILHHPYLFCSLSCKVYYHDDGMTPEEPKKVVLLDRILTTPDSTTNISNSSSCRTPTVKKRSISDYNEPPHHHVMMYRRPVDVDVGGNRRRKGVPQRSPLN
ncbi:hypothetical protein G4B88_014551 [Cannabis sativa]|uniref:B box-type domain-containing protein n=1 Tax=Cannabis sativa TaxID=3483 RepID=A0A7J6IAA6_CANSA|nr:hypothetical protein G4B88_014551 [Cannabis sativa]